MARLSRRLRTFSDGSVERYPELWRVDHDRTFWRPNLPEVFPFFPNHYTKFTRDFQLLEKSLNPFMTGAKFVSLHGYTTAFNNKQGYGMTVPRVDFINGTNLGAEPPYQEALVCGGAVLAEKYRDANYLYPEYIDGNKSAPTTQYILDHPWLAFDALSVDWSAQLKHIILRRFPQGGGHRVIILLLANRPIKIHLSKVTKLTYGGTIPSAYAYP